MKDGLIPFGRLCTENAHELMIKREDGSITKVLSWHSEELDLVPCSAINFLCDSGQVTYSASLLGKEGVCLTRGD